MLQKNYATLRKQNLIISEGDQENIMKNLRPCLSHILNVMAGHPKYASFRKAVIMGQN